MKLLWSLLVVAAASFSGVEAVQYVVDRESSIGARFPLSDDHRTLPGWRIYGQPQILSDRVILTPPAPGNQRIGLWSTQPTPYDEWAVTTEFRANGGERAGGSLHLWYTAWGGSGGSATGQDSIYTSKPWTGLALVIDSHTGPGGSIRGYLNDGQTDYSQHHNPASLAFAHCDFDYRNKGSLSKITLTQGQHLFKVQVDGKLCFQTDKARLPRDYYFGITAATTETPDSFELFNFIVSGLKNERSRQREEPQKQQGHQPQQQNLKQKEKEDRKKDRKKDRRQRDKDAEHYERPDGKLPHEEDFEDWHVEEGEEDHDASYYKSQGEQFTDVHKRLQALTHHLAALQRQFGMIYDRVDSLHHNDEEHRSEWRNTRVPREQIDAMDHRLAVIEHLSTEIAGAMTSKDYTSHFEELRKILQEHHADMLYSVPDTVHQVLTHGGPRIGMMVTVVVLVQVALAGCYVIYKKRRNSSPKKYL